MGVYVGGVQWLCLQCICACVHKFCVCVVFSSSWVYMCEYIYIFVFLFVCVYVCMYVCMCVFVSYV